MTAYRHKELGLEPRLRHVDGWPVMSITEAPQTMDLTLTNRHGVPVRTDGGTVSLLFRPGVLTDDDRRDRVAVAAQNDAAWERGRITSSAAGTRIPLKARSALEVANGESWTIRLDGLQPAEDGGSRATRVQVGFTGFTDAAGNSVDGHRLMHLSVLRRHDPASGLTEPAAAPVTGTAAVGPFLAGFLGGNGVLNDGESETTLRLRIVNATAAALKVDAGDAPTRFTIGYLTGDALAPWGLLGSRHDHLGLVPAANSLAEWEVDRHTVRRREDGVWRGGDSLDLELTVDTQAAAGATALVVGFENVPGHDDGDLVLPVEIGTVVIGQAGLRAVRPVRLLGPAAALSFSRHRNVPWDAVPGTASPDELAAVEQNEEAALRLDRTGRLRIEAEHGVEVAADVTLGSLTATGSLTAAGSLTVGGPLTAHDAATFGEVTTNNVAVHDALAIGPLADDDGNAIPPDDILRLGRNAQRSWVNSRVLPLVLNIGGQPVGVGKDPGAGATLDVDGLVAAEKVRIGGRFELSVNWTTEGRWQLVATHVPSGASAVLVTGVERTT